MDQPVGVEKSRPLQLISDGPRIVEYDGRFREPTQDAPGHRAETQRPGVCDLIKKATEAVQVVAIHAGSPRRKGVNKLAIRVIGNVEQVKSPNRLACISGEVAEPIEQPIRVECGAMAADHGQSAGEPAEWRAKSGGINGEWPISWHVVEQHVSAQVHALPPFFREVSQDCEPAGHCSASFVSLGADVPNTTGR